MRLETKRRHRIRARPLTKEPITQLGEALGSSAPNVTPQLQELTRRYATSHLAGNVGASGTRPSTTEIQQLLTGMRRLIHRIDGTSVKTQRDLANYVTLNTLVSRDDLWTKLTHLRGNALSAVAVLEQILRKGSRRGRPPDIERQRLAEDIALLLAMNRLPVRATRDGLFDQVLETVLKGLYGSVPDDRMDLLKQGSQFVRGRTVIELHEILSRWRYCDDPFWRQFSVP